MNVKQPPENPPDVQAAIYRVALSLDSFLTNGIPFGLFFTPGFLEKVAGILLKDLISLEECALDAPTDLQPNTKELLAGLRKSCQQMIDWVTGLKSFQTLSLEQLRFAVERIPELRLECVQKIQELERCFGTPKPFYQSRPSNSTALMDGFLTNLECLFTEKWAASRGQESQREGAQNGGVVRTPLHPPFDDRVVLRLYPLREPAA